MGIDELRRAMDADSVIDSSQLDSESLLTIRLHAKWYGYYIAEISRLRTLEEEYDITLKSRTDYYLGRSNDDCYKSHPLNVKLTKSEVDVYLKSDAELNEIKRKKNKQQVICDAIESYIKQINARSYNIRNAIDFIKFKNGLN